MFELSLIYELMAGRHDPLQVGELPIKVCRHIECRLPFVYLSRETLDKIVRKHPEVSVFDLLLLPDLLKNGRYVGDRKNELVVAYRLPETGKDYVAAIKTTKDAFENYVTTFHRSDAKKIARAFRRGSEILR